jgi:hypothetical protein
LDGENITGRRGVGKRGRSVGDVVLIFLGNLRMWDWIWVWVNEGEG